MAASTVESPRTDTLGPVGARVVAPDARAVDEMLAGTGLVLEVERWPDECPAGHLPDEDEPFRDAVSDGLVSCYEVTLATAAGDHVASAVVWSSAGVACGPYTSCSALGQALAQEVAEALGRVLSRC